MKVLSLLQPWATLVVIGAKKIETRSWNTKYRGPLLIHASKRKITLDEGDAEFFEHLFNIIPQEEYASLPYGGIIGSVDLVDTESTIELCSIPEIIANNIKWEMTDQELSFGDFSAFRYGWLLKDPVQFKTPIPMKGSLSLWDCPIQICTKCGCTDNDCRHCMEKTGKPCHWVEENLCSACK